MFLTLAPSFSWGNTTPSSLVMNHFVGEAIPLLYIGMVGTSGLGLEFLALSRTRLFPSSELHDEGCQVSTCVFFRAVPTSVAMVCSGDPFNQISTQALRVGGISAGLHSGGGGRRPRAPGAQDVRVPARCPLHLGSLCPFMKGVRSPCLRDVALEGLLVSTEEQPGTGPGMLSVSVRTRGPVCVHTCARSAFSPGRTARPCTMEPCAFSLRALHVLRWPFAVRPQGLRSFYPWWAA